MREDNSNNADHFDAAERNSAVPSGSDDPLQRYDNLKCSKALVAARSGVGRLSSVYKIDAMYTLLRCVRNVGRDE